MQGTSGTCLRAFPHSPASFSKAKKACEEDGSNLVQLIGIETQRDIEKLIRDLKSDHPDLFGELDNFWIGGSYYVEGRRWKWDEDGETSLDDFNMWDDTVKSSNTNLFVFVGNLDVIFSFCVSRSRLPVKRVQAKQPRDCHPIK